MIDYAVAEVPVEGYSPKVTGDAERGFTVTNTVKTGELDVSKTSWRARAWRSTRTRYLSLWLRPPMPQAATKCPAPTVTRRSRTARRPSSSKMARRRGSRGCPREPPTR